MKKILLALVILCSVFSLQAQVQGKIRVAGNIGLALPAAGAGFSMDVLDVRYNILDNLNAGIKFGFGFMVRDIYQSSPTLANGTMHISTNTMLVSDYYFHNGSSAFAPFVGGGIGSFSIYDINMDIDPSQGSSYTVNDMPSASKTIGGAIRGGFELGRLRLAMEYYMIPKTTMYSVTNIMQPMSAQSPNSYLTVNLGIVLGGGKWRR